MEKPGFVRLHPEDINLIVSRIAQAIKPSAQDRWIKSTKEAADILGRGLSFIQMLRDEATPRIKFEKKSHSKIWYSEKSLIEFKEKYL